MCKSSSSWILIQFYYNLKDVIVGYIISMPYIPKKSTQCVKDKEITSGWKGYLLENSIGWPTEPIS